MAISSFSLFIEEATTKKGASVFRRSERTFCAICDCGDGKFVKSKKVWCVVKDGIFYGYEKQTSKFQNFSFPLKGMLNVNFATICIEALL